MINSKDLEGRGCSIYLDDPALFWNIQHEKVDEEGRTVGPERKIPSGVTVAHFN
jgi:catechol-2,3-dioxygenase